MTSRSGDVGRCDHCGCIGWVLPRGVMRKHVDTIRGLKSVPILRDGKVVAFQSKYLTCEGSGKPPRRQE